MNSYILSPAAHDLDGLTFPTTQHEIPQLKREYGLNADFGFDPSLTEQNMFDQYSGTASKLATWGGFGNRNVPPQMPQDVVARQYTSAHRHSLSLPQLQQQNGALAPKFMNSGPGSLSLNTKNLPNNTSTMSLYGQVTPPRSNSATSEPPRNGQDPASAISEPSTTKRRRGKAQSKNPLTPPEDDNNNNNNTPKQKKTGGRKRTMAAQSHAKNPEDDKRMASLEKNRVAAAKCRVNKKEKTEQLQRDSHTKAQENRQLRGLVETMEAERNSLAAYLGAHASCADCRDPVHLKEALEMFQENEMRNSFPGLVGEAVTANTSPVLSMSSGLYDDTGLTSTYSSMNPPLPDFNLSGDYDMNSPLPS
jgi:hypothetical protein